MEGNQDGTLTHGEFTLHGGAPVSGQGPAALQAHGLLDGVVHVVVHDHGHLDGHTRR